MSELQSALDVLAADDLHTMVAPQLLDRTAELARNRIDAELARTSGSPTSPRRRSATG